MSPTLHHECTRVSVTALASCGTLLVAAEGPFLRFYHAKTFQYITAKRVFKAQAIHGISVYAEEHNDVHVIKLVVWAGQLICALRVYDSEDGNLHVDLSNIIKSPDWILDLAPRPTSLDDDEIYNAGACVAVTAHNALVQINVKCEDDRSSKLEVSLHELTSSSRSILYSAHVFWESPQCVLVAAGTAFGEIIYWSWGYKPNHQPLSLVHRVFLGHEGSIFGVRISKELPSGCCQNLRRVVASCSDDRTIRIWDVSDIDISSEAIQAIDTDTESERTRHTGFSNEAFDTTSSTHSECLAIGWGHASRVWNVHFLESKPCEGSLRLISTGEDATTRTWRLTPHTDSSHSLPYGLSEVDCAAYHSGKNIWSFDVHSGRLREQKVICGAADSKITAVPLVADVPPVVKDAKNTVYEYSVQTVLSMAQRSNEHTQFIEPEIVRSSKKAEFFRSYCPVSQDKFLLTTNSGNILCISLDSFSSTGAISSVSLIDQRGDLAGYSVCAGDPSSGTAFVSGATGTIYAYTEATNTITRLANVNGKVGELFVSSMSDGNGQHQMTLLATLVGQKQAELHYLQESSQGVDSSNLKIKVSIPETLVGSLITSMTSVGTSNQDFLILGFRRGSICLYSITKDSSQSSESTSLLRHIEKAHGDETVTAFKWVSKSQTTSLGHLLSVGRDGRLVVYALDLLENSFELTHSSTLPIGPNIEGIYSVDDHLLVHGFSNKKWLLYDVKTEEEVMGVETGGAHRSWTFQPHSFSFGGTLVWTRASSMHIYRRTQPNHELIRSGGHGREIKAVAVSPDPSKQIIATGAEDTDIKLFQYVNGDLICRKTLRKHTTGIQHLEWSDDGKYLFSSGGCEEFYIWRVRSLPSFLDIGVVCEHVYVPESEYSDLRIMSFDIMESGTGYIIAMVFSDSSIKVYRYDTKAAVKWRPLARGLYFTSCLTQCQFLSHDRILTAGTDGHSVVWHVPTTATTSQDSTSISAVAVKWQQPTRIHQSSSKSMDSYRLSNGSLLVASGGDDGSLSFLLVKAPSRSSSLSSSSSDIVSTLVISRTHASAVTACALLENQGSIYAITSGNDQWVRLWKLHVQDAHTIGDSKDSAQQEESTLMVTRGGKTKTSVADVSSTAMLDVQDNGMARVLICGVGMEIIRVDWADDDLQTTDK